MIRVGFLDGFFGYALQLKFGANSWNLCITRKYDVLHLLDKKFRKSFYNLALDLITFWLSIIQSFMCQEKLHQIQPVRSMF